jgi:YegS/Rv2252/BmrU family lipid kinase
VTIVQSDSAVLFANPRSGRARRWLFPALVALEKSGIRLGAVRFDLRPESVKDVVDKIRKGGRDLVIAFGGDGTVGTVVNAVVDTGAAVGVIPAGTSNNFARSLGIPVNVKSAVAVIARGLETKVDIGEANGQYFAHAAIMGLNVDFARYAQRFRPYIGRLSYPLASLLVYWHRQTFSVSIAAEDGVPKHFIAYEVAVLNSSRFGGFLSLHEPETSIEDGTLRVLVVTDLRLRTVVKGLPRMFFQRYLGLPGAHGFNMQHGVIETEGRAPMTLDGEIKIVTPATLRSVPGGLRVIVGTSPDRIA